jgi:hypothetical protein
VVRDSGLPGLPVDRTGHADAGAYFRRSAPARR